MNKKTFNKTHFKPKTTTEKKKEVMRSNTLFKACKQINV